MERYTLPAGVLERDIIYPNSILIPTDDDKPANAETVRSAMRGLSDRTRQLHSALAWNRIQCDVFCDDGANLWIDSLAGCPVYDPVADQWYLFRGPIPDSAIGPIPGGVLAANTWYYLYAGQTAGAITFKLSTTAPDRLLTSENGDVAFRYLCTVRTAGANTIVPFRFARGKYRYEARQQIGGFTAPTSFADPTSVIDASSRVPPHVRIAEIIVNANNFGLPGVIDNVTVRKNAGNGNIFFGTLTTMNQFFGPIPIPLDGIQKFQSTLTVGTNSQTFYVVGWDE